LYTKYLHMRPCGIDASSQGCTCACAGNTEHTASDVLDASVSGRDRLAEIRETLLRAAEARDGPKDGIVAVKVSFAFLE
jgi:hypothetical protein